MALIVMTFIRMLHKEMMEDQEEKEMTWRQAFIKMTVLGLWFIAGVLFLGAMDYVIGLVS